MPASTPPGFPSPELAAVAARIEPVLRRFLRDRRAELAAMDPAAAALADEISRLLAAGGKRLRPALCFWAYRAAAGEGGEAIARVCGALELLHTSAIVHDDLMDGDDERRGVPASHVRFAKEAPPGADPDAFGSAAAILVGDLALVLSEQLMRTSGFAPDVLARATARFDRMRVEMAAGQLLDVSGSGDPARISALKSGSYSAEGPVRIGAALARAEPPAEEALSRYAGLVGEAFQLRDDVLDGQAPPGSGAAEIASLLARARRALEGGTLHPEGAAALARIADLLAIA